MSWVRSSREPILRLLSCLLDKITNGPDEDCIHHPTNICDWAQIGFTVSRTVDISDESKLCLISTINLSWFETYFVTDNCQPRQRNGKRVSLIIWRSWVRYSHEAFLTLLPSLLDKITTVRMKTVSITLQTFVNEGRLGSLLVELRIHQTSPNFA